MLSKEQNKKEEKMVKKCLYCKTELSGESLIDFCDGCGIKVWGEKMLAAIKQNMVDASLRGDLAFNDPKNHI